MAQHGQRCAEQDGVQGNAWEKLIEESECWTPHLGAWGAVPPCTGSPIPTHPSPFHPSLSRWRASGAGAAIYGWL